MKTMGHLLGFFMSLWSALLGRKLFPARPVLPREARMVGIGVLFGVVVVPGAMWWGAFPKAFGGFPQ